MICCSTSSCKNEEVRNIEPHFGVAKWFTKLELVNKTWFKFQTESNDSFWIRLRDGIEIPFQSTKILKLAINCSPTSKTFAHNVIIL